jgi:hypothetical protein
MRNISILLLALASFGIVSGNAGQAASPQTPNPPADRKPVVIELFTSEGCSSCPPADALLKALELRQPIAGAEIIALEEHVDYWNKDGWEDPFSSAEWTVRQQEYVSKFKGQGPYTPQMIVDGEKEFTGNNAREAQETIQAASQQPMANVSITVEPAAKNDEQRFQVRVGDMPGSGDEKADVWLAVTEDGLQANVDAGENKGRTLQHAAVVRSLQKIGSTASKSSQFSAEPQVRFKSNWKKENLHVVVFVQDKKSWRILGAASTKLAS